MSNLESNYTDKLNAINQAIKIKSLNLGTWIALTELYKTNLSISINQYNILITNIISIFGDSPLPMYDLLLQFREVYVDK